MKGDKLTTELQDYSVKGGGKSTVDTNTVDGIAWYPWEDLQATIAYDSFKLPAKV